MSRRLLNFSVAVLLVCVGSQVTAQEEKSQPASAGIADRGGTLLVFRTPPGAVSVSPGQSKQLATLDVSPFSRIRVVATERVGSAGPVTIRLTITEGSEWVAPLDELKLTPRSQVTRVYEVPGTKLTILADAPSDAGSDSVDVLVYGAR